MDKAQKPENTMLFKANNPNLEIHLASVSNEYVVTCKNTNKRARVFFAFLQNFCIFTIPYK